MGGSVPRCDKRAIVLLHVACLLFHLSGAFTALYFGWGKDLGLQLYVVKLKWVEGSDEMYSFELQTSDLRAPMDIMTAAFFGLSALQHFVWVALAVAGWLLPTVEKFMETYFWEELFSGHCWWRWVEYSLSATVMLVQIALLVGMREVYQLQLLAGLSFTTMLCGWLTEVWAVYNPKSSYALRMLPHLLGWLPYISAWAAILAHFFSYDSVPAFVVAIVVGCAVSFTSFAFVQIHFQRYINDYYKTEYAYCLLSLASKGYLGGFVLSNVILSSTGTT